MLSVLAKKEKKSQKNSRKILEVMNIHSSLVMVMVSGVYIYIQTHQMHTLNVYVFVYAMCMCICVFTYKLYLNKEKQSERERGVQHHLTFRKKKFTLSQIWPT